MNLFPIQRPSYKDSMESYNQLKDLDTSTIMKDGEWHTRSKLDGKLDKYININKDGSKFSNHFHWAYRMACDSLTSPSPLRSWYNPKIRKSVENCKFYKDNPATGYEPNHILLHLCIDQYFHFPNQL